MQNILVEYYRDKKGAPKGVVVAVKIDNESFIGWSMCHRRDVFCKSRALDMAVGRALAYGGVSFAPISLHPLMLRMMSRAKKYFRVPHCLSSRHIQ